MKILRVLALGAMLGIIAPAVSLASSDQAKEHKQNINVADQAQLNGTMLQPGRFKVEWNGPGPMITVKFVRNGETVVTTPARLVQLAKPAPYDAVEERSHTNGSKTIDEIEWSNQRGALKFGRQGPGQG